MLRKFLITSSLFTVATLSPSLYARTASTRPTTTYPTSHIGVSQDLLRLLTAPNNIYASPSTITWPDEGTPYLHSQCAPFLTMLLKKTYSAQGLNNTVFKGLFNSTSPYPAGYIEAIDNGATYGNWSLKQIPYVTSMITGDIIAIDYQDNACSNGAPPSVTGHVLLVTGAPVYKSRDLSKNEYYYEVPVMDSTSSPHGATDSRRNGQTGLGTGKMVLITNSVKQFKGYRWAPEFTTFCTQAQRYLTVGRIQYIKP